MYYAGIDLGGTNIAVGIVDENGNIIEQMSAPTGAERDYREIVKDMADIVKKLCEKLSISEKDIKAVGIGCPGSIDSEKGICEYANNLNMYHAEIASEFRKYIDIPVTLENDANAAALGEYEINAKGSKSFVFVTLGTGVGGGIIINGEIFRGFNGVGAELGHIVIDVDGEQCTCGRKGCWEAYASATALINQTKTAMEENPESIMHELAAAEGKVSGRTAFDAMRRNDSAGIKVVDQYIKYVACGITNLVNALQPEIICIGGGICNEGETLLRPIRRYVEAERYSVYSKVQTLVVKATLGNDAGIIGAALLGLAK